MGLKPAVPLYEVVDKALPSFMLCEVIEDSSFNRGFFTEEQLVFAKKQGGRIRVCMWPSRDFARICYDPASGVFVIDAPSLHDVARLLQGHMKIYSTATERIIQRIERRGKA